MKKVELTFVEQKGEQEKAINSFIEFFSLERDLSKIIYESWTAKDVLGHIASWHMSFAKNLLDAVKGIKPTPFKGSLTDVNETEVKIMAQYTTCELISKIKNAQEIISNNIDNSNIKGIAYKKGSRDYSPIEHLEVVRRHINGHLKDLLKIYNS